MVDAKHTELLKQVLELLDTACQASLELLKRYEHQESDAMKQLLSDLRAVTEAVYSAQKPILPALEHAYTTEMLENVMDTLDDIERSIGKGDTKRAAIKMEFQLFPFLRQLKEAFYFWGVIYPDKDRMKQYYQEEFAEHFKNLYVQEGEEPRYKLSIVVPAYNHLETTKRCIEQLLKETDFEKLNAELILIDHGSTDGTLEYFEGLEVGKVIHFKNNVRMYMFITMFQLCQGKYFAYVSNDILVTRNWAEILTEYLKGDSQIILAVPSTPNVSNMQAVEHLAEKPDRFVAWANEQNTFCSVNWSERSRVMAPIGLFNIEAVNKIGYADPYFYSMEYFDDDFSLRARRAGYRQIVCENIFCYHFGSLTFKAAQNKEGTLQYGRHLFIQKNSVDAWGNGFCYDFRAVQLLKQILASQKQPTVLGLDCGMGDTLFQIRNELRHQQRECSLVHLTCQDTYYPDTALLLEAKLVPNLLQGLTDVVGSRTFSVVCLGRDISHYEDGQAILAAVQNRLVSGGYFVFTCDNPFYVLTSHAMLNLMLPDNSARFVLADPQKIKEEAETVFSQVQVLAVENPVEGMEQFAKQHYGSGKELPQIMKKISEKKYYFVCRKE